MRKLIIVAVIFLLLLSSNLVSAENKDVKAAFIRDGNLWILFDNAEKQITDTGNVFGKPEWSLDGKWIVFQRNGADESFEEELRAEVWIYNVETKEKKKLFDDGYSPKWSPVKNEVAFNAKGILNISNLNKFYNIATGVDGYAWLPDGSGFLLSSSGVLRPDGWTSARFYTKKISENYSDVILFGGVDPFFILPREIGIGDNEIIAVNAGDIAFSTSKKWISFIVSPTASWSMDSNMLCVISNDGEDFEVLDEVVFDVGEPKWAPSSDTIAYIAGGGRIVFGFKDKDLKVREMPVSGSYTPADYADFDFDWITDKEIVVSRVKEKEWSNDFSKHPLPTLYYIDLNTNKQVLISTPPKGFGDYSPQYIDSIN